MGWPDGSLRQAAIYLHFIHSTTELCKTNQALRRATESLGRSSEWVALPDANDRPTDEI